MNKRVELLYLYDRISALLDEHGDINDCKVADCKTCEEIERNRAKLTGTQYVKTAKGKYIRAVKKYTVIDEHGKDRFFYNFKDVVSYMSAGQKTVREVLNTGRSHNGFTVDVEDLESD